MIAPESCTYLPVRGVRMFDVVVISRDGSASTTRNVAEWIAREKAARCSRGAARFSADSSRPDRVYVVLPSRSEVR